jgi:hypothetical protein
MLKRRFFCFSWFVVAIVLVPAACFAQSGGSAASAPSGLPILPILMALIGVLTSAYNSGSVLGWETLPKAWLPWLGLGVSFLTGATRSLESTGTTATGVILTAIGAGFVALGANGVGSALHWQATVHKRPLLATTKKDDGAPPPPSSDPGPTRRLNVVEQEAAKLPPAAQRVAIYGGWVVALCVALSLVACVPAASPQQQVAQLQAAEQCIQTHWGEPIEQLAGTCLQSIVPATEDVVADIEAIIELAEGQTGGTTAVATAQAAFPYRGNPTVTGLVESKKSTMLARKSVTK